MAKRGAQAAANDLAAQWDTQPDTTELTLPTGKTMIVRAPDLPDLALRGIIPNHLLPVVEKFIFDGKNGAEQARDLLRDDRPPGEKLVHYAEFLQHLDCFMVAAAVAPRVSFDGAPGTVGVKRLAIDEKMHVWRWSEGLLAPLAEFPADGTGPVEPLAELHDGEGVRDATE